MKEREVVISAPKIETIEFNIQGTAPLVQLRFTQKALNTMKEKYSAGSLSKKKTAKESRDFNEEFYQAPHRSQDGWCGINAGAFRAAMISACRLVGFKMTLAKLSVFIDADGFDSVDQVPLIKIIGEPEPHLMHVRNSTGVADLRMRAKFFPWSANLRVSYDADQFSAQDIANLVCRVGMQVGIGEGRPDGKMGAGMGWGTFKIN